jgi:hypothetical protein
MAAALLAVLISGVLLDSNDKPLPKHYLAFVLPNDKWLEVVTDKDGKFRVNLAPGTYDYRLGGLNKAGQITVYKSTSTLKLKEPPKEPNVIKVIRSTQGDVILPKGPRG